MDVAAWLRDLGLGQYEQSFRENDVDAEVLADLTAEDLIGLGVTSIGHRRKLLAAIAALRTGSIPVTTPRMTAPAAVPGTALPFSEAERRQVTVMFADLVGSTAMVSRVDPEEMRKVIRAYQNTVSGEISRYAGHVAKFMGDGVLAYFGWPKAHEDDAERAARAGLAVTQSVAGLTSPDGQPLAARVGIATGLVVVGDLVGSGEAQERDVIGETPNLAARLQALARPGQVVIAESTWRLLGRLFEVEDLGQRALDGFDEPLRIFLLGPSVAEDRFEALHGTGLVPLVGREQELALLLDRWARVRDGEGQVVLLSGEPGIGKSRLVRALRERLARETYTPLSHFCSPFHQTSPLHPVIDLLERGAGFARDDGPLQKLDELEALIAVATRDVAGAAPLLAALLSVPTAPRYPPLELSPEQQKRRTFDALVDQLTGLAAHRPVLAVYEDVHWADPSTLEWLESAIERVQTLPILVLITCRPEFSPRWTGHAHLTLLTLSRLGRRQGASMVEQLTGGKALPAEVLAQVLARTDGVPLFVEELTKAILESGMLAEESDRYILGGPLPPLAIPATLHDSLMARLDRFAPVKQVAQIASCIGREFSYDLVSMTAPLGEAMLQDALKGLCASELVFCRGTPPNATYRFKHALVHEVAYRSLLRSRRQQLHARIATVLEEHFPESAETEPEVLGHHYAEAGLTEQAVAYLQRAGVRALERSAYLEAISHLARGLELLEASSDTTERAQRELELQLALGSALMATKGYAAPEVEQAYVRARALCSHIDLTPQLFPVLHGLYRIYHVRGDLIAARGVGEHLTELGQSLGDQTLLVEANRALGVPLLWLGEVALARAKLEEGTALYDAKLLRSHANTYGIDPGVVCLSYAALAWWFLGFADHALDRSQRALALAEELSHPHSRALALVWAAWLRQFRREVPGTEEMAQAAIRLCSEHGYPLWRAMGTILHGWALSESGQKPEECIAQMRQGMADLRATGAGLWQPCFLALIAEACDKANRLDEGLTVLDHALGIVQERAERFCEAELHRLRGALLLRCNPVNVSACETCFRTAIAIARNQQARSLELRAATSLARLWAERGERRNAQDLLTGICGWFTEGFDTLDLREAQTLLSEMGGPNS
ncbi:AAA family ATPase [Bradyrhizobium japonicum]|uniref:AAA family ATPase n=1 Tax=Bradyrhizobium japonicum TaxID=375 RepID=UPI003514A49D